MSTTQVNGGLIAVSGLAGDLAGATTFWQLSGNVQAYALRHAGAVAGIDAKHLPGDTTPKTAIRRACMAQTGKRLMARSLSSGAWAMVREVEVNTINVNAGSVRNATLDHKVVLTCRVDNVTQTLVFSGDEEHDALRYAIQEAYHVELAQLDATDLSGWLVDTASRILAVPLRDRGGVYFIPKQAMDEWRKVASVLRHVAPGCDVFELPTLRSDEAVRSIVAAVTREAEQATSELMAKIEAGELGERALKARQKDCDALCQKLEQYETLLGASLDKVKAHVEATGAAAMAAALIASAEVDSAA